MSPGHRISRKTAAGAAYKDEPASLDPAKAVGLPEIQVIRDLFEGLVNQDAKGNIIPGVATRWQSNDNRVWTFTLRDNARWSDGTPVTARISSIAGSVWLIRKPPRLSPGSPRWRGSQRAKYYRR
jgi:oligopeptide transport system substrate-binding protein